MMYFLDENFWITVSFVFLLYFAFRPVKSVVLNFLDTQIDKIKEKISQSEECKLNAKMLFEEIQRDIENFELYRQRTITKVKISTQKLVERKREEAERAFSLKTKEATRVIENESSRVIQQLRVELTNISTEMVRKYLTEISSTLSDKEIISIFINKEESGRSNVE